MTLTNTPPAAAVSLAQHWLKQDLSKALGNFTWVNNMTLGARFCRFAYEGDDHCLTMHTGLPFLGVSVEGHDPAIIRRLVAELLAGQDTDSKSVYTLAAKRIAEPLTQAVEVLEVQNEWQMLYRGDPSDLDPGPARLLGPADLPAMLALAEACHSMVFGPDTFARNDFFGIEIRGELVAMGGVQTQLAGLAEIGSIATHPTHRRQGHASQIVAALVHHLTTQNQHVFLCLFQTNTAARALYERLDFDIVHELRLLRWQLPFNDSVLSEPMHLPGGQLIIDH